MAKLDKPDKPDKTPKPDGAKKKFIVASSFRDKDDYSREYLPGDDVSYFDADRLEHLQKNGLVSNDQ